MSDGTTAFQVSPADFAKEFVAQLHSAFARLETAEAELATARQVNIDLTQSSDYWQGCYDRAKDQILELTAERDRLRDDIALANTQGEGTARELAEVRATCDRLAQEAEGWHNCFDSTTERLRIVEAERDDYGMKHLAATEALEVAKAKLDKFRRVLADDPDMPTPLMADAGLKDEPASILHGHITYLADAPAVTDERAADGPSAFPSPAPIAEPSQEPAGTEPTTAGPKDDWRDEYKF